MATYTQEQQPSGYRTPLAVHLPQELIPLGSSISKENKRQSLQVPHPSYGYQQPQQQAVGYSPHPPSSPTPLQKLSQQFLHEESEFDYLCCPLSNSSWYQRWERMCVARPAAAASNVGASSSRMLDNMQQYDSAAQLAGDGEDPEEYAERMREAELWRMAGCFNRGEVNATRSEETGQMIAMAPEWLELDAEVEGIRFDSELALKQEVAYAAHLHVQTLILPPPRNPLYITDYARAVANVLATPGFLQLSVRIPVSDPADPHPNVSTRTWDMWNTIRSLCAYNPRLSLTLDISTPLTSPAILSRWAAEPLKFIFLPATTYLANAKGYPVLSKSCQAFFRTIFKYKPTIIISGVHKNVHPVGGIEAYTSYIRFLERKTPIEDPLEQFAGAYMDYLQAPLQPLMDNLENDTYEGFERDPVKYRQYEEAVYQALVDRTLPNGPPAIVFVCGAGRGPLVEGCLRAARRAERRIQLTAVEKNPNAFVILQERKALEWGNSVELVFSDMRSFQPSQPADIIVSELLGSFGDNELSPECLDGVMRCLSPAGISIPSSYTSYLAPVASSKLHSEVSNSTESKVPEQPYVVMFNASTVLSEQGGRENFAKFAECWTFDHPRNDIVTDETGIPLTNHHNARSAHVTFNIPYGGICHGFGGYFEAVLYNDIGISIHPERMDKNMLSWFPLFFPLKEPLYLPPRSELDAHVFRLVDGARRRVWFEWSAEAFLPLPAHTIAPSPTHSASTNTNATNGNGRPRSSIGMEVRQYSQGVPIPSPMIDSVSPYVGGGNDSMSSAGFMLDTHRSNAYEGIVRLKIGQSKLHNPAGRSSWVGL